MIELLQPRHLVPVVPRGLVLDDPVVVLREGRIDAILTAAEADELHPGVPRVELSHHVLLPGLMNMHAHSAMTLLRGYADDLDLKVWLNEHIWPAEKRWLGEEFVADALNLLLLLFLLSTLPSPLLYSLF